MICKRCQRSLRANEGLKCSSYESSIHKRSAEEKREPGKDKSYEWKCSICRGPIRHVHEEESNRDKEISALIIIINNMSEKFELVNKIQLPKLNSDIALVKSVTNQIVQQNQNILTKIDEIQHKRKSENQAHPFVNRYRKRRVEFAPPKVVDSWDNNDDLPLQSTAPFRYRTRRRSYLLQRIFKLLNRKINALAIQRK